MRKQRITRRSFLHKAGLSAVAASSSPLIKSAYGKSLAFTAVNKWPGRGVLNFNENADQFGSINYTTVKQMVDESIKELTGETTVDAAWENLFPSTITLNDKIAIKINNSYTLKTCWQVVKAVVEGLKSMLGGTYPASNITLYDQNRWSSYNLSTNFPGVNTAVATGSGQSDAVVGRQYPVCLRDASYLIDIPVLKSHPYTVYGRVSLGFKSHIGTYRSGHSGFDTDDLLLLSQGVVRDKRVLTLIDAIHGTMHDHNGSADPFPTYTAGMRSTGSSQQAPCTIIMSTDPCTSEYWGRQIFRLEHEDPSYGGNPDVLIRAQELELGIGDATDPAWDYREIINGSLTTTVGEERFVLKGGLKLSKGYPSPASTSAALRYSVPSALKTNPAHLCIYDVKGSLLRKIPVNPNKTYISWDLSDNRGRAVTSGRYIAKLIVGTASVVRQIIVRR